MAITIQRPPTVIPQFEIYDKSNELQLFPRQKDRQDLQDWWKGKIIEFTLAIGCPVQCTRYCPQEVFMKRYGNKNRLMSFEVFKQLLAKVPTDVQVIFSGFCEPFVNPDFVKMAEYAYYNGYRLQVWTTLFGAKRSDVERLLNLEYSHFRLHLRDGQTVKFPLTQEYQDNVFRVIEGIPNVTFCLMNDLFQTNNRENVARGILPATKKVGYCYKLETPQFVLLPDGSMQLCCMDFGLEHSVGNLLNEDYESIKNRFMAKKCAYRRCAYCDQSISPRQHLYETMVSKVKSISHKVISL